MTDRPFPPARYSLLVVGSGPGALQLTYSLRRLGVEHAVISQYREPCVVFAVGIAEPWKPSVLDIEGVQQYGQLRPAEQYADKRVFIVGKQNSGFEIASGLLPWARQIVLASPSSAKLSVDTRTLVGVRARYVQPYEDWSLAGGVVIP